MPVRLRKSIGSKIEPDGMPLSIRVHKKGTVGHAQTYYSDPDRGVEYCDDSLCLSVFVCLSVRKHISGNTRPIFTKFTVRVTYGRGSVLFWRRCDKLCTSGFMDDVIFPHKPKQLNVAAQLMEGQPTYGLRLDYKRRLGIPIAGQCTHTHRPTPRA